MCWGRERKKTTDIDKEKEINQEISKEEKDRRKGHELKRTEKGDGKKALISTSGECFKRPVFLSTPKAP